MNFRGFCIVLVAALAAAVSAHAQTPSATAQPGPAAAAPAGQINPADATSSAYVLGRDDVIEVGLLGGGTFGGRARVQADGTIQLSFIGKIPAADRTTAELSDVIRKTLQTGGFFTDPVVTIEVVGYASRYVTVLGAVGSPGLIPINRPYRLSEILARVGGVRDGAADYIVVRSAKGEERKLFVTDLARGDLSQDPFVQAGDKIYAPVAETFYIYGKVNSPGTFVLQADTTIGIAIAKAGGLAESGSDKKVDVTRAGKKIKLRLEDKVQPGDVVVIGEKLF